MRHKLFFLPVALLLLVFSVLQSQDERDEQSLYVLFDKAETLFNGVATAETDSVALQYYRTITQKLQPSVKTAPLLYDAHERAGILMQGLGYNSTNVLQEYYAALEVLNRFKLTDSIAFRLYLSAGNMYYTEGSFDSSLYYLRNAEDVITRYPDAGLAGDLYNSLGALYSESGDYMQSGYYFKKALEVTEQTRPDLKEAIFAMSANIAAAVRFSGNLDSAIHLYTALIDPTGPSLPVLNNLGGIYLTRHMPDSALYYLSKARNIDGNYAINFYNSLARAYLQKRSTDSAMFYLNKASETYRQKPAGQKNNYYGATCKYFGDMYVQQQNYTAALKYYQQSLIQHSFKFNDTNVYANPGNFIGDFASYDLFDALTAKAICFTRLYTQNKTGQFFDAARSTFDSAFALADYIKKSIDNDEARLFIADKVVDAYRAAVDFIIAANTKNDSRLVKHALEWISESRATSLAIGLKENRIKSYAGLPDSLLQREKNLKIGLSRMQLQLQQTTDSSSQNELLSAINTSALQLQSLQNEYKKFPAYYQQKFAADNVNIDLIQQNVLNANSAAICYYSGSNTLKAFLVKHDAIIEEDLSKDSLLFAAIENYINELTGVTPGKLYNNANARYLYAQLIKPLADHLAGIDHIIIIPDKELINIPFEAFEDVDGKYLLERFSITYQYALPFLHNSVESFDKNNSIAFAPFASAGSHGLQVLPSSKEEINDFPAGNRFVDTAATKEHFLTRAPGAHAIHLATHAAVNYNEPSQSFIAFFNNNTKDTGYKVFAHELYNMQLTKTDLVFLSACETGSGKISQSEGALSLSRAFAFAGCPNIITSLWKAEDKTTAYISNRFYGYTAKGYTYAAALRQAKVDLLQDESMSQYHSPQYWSNLIFIGDVQQQSPAYWLWVVVVLVAVIVLLAFQKSRRKAAA
ncbi:CHAT domain-containing protein [Panacibacter sp. DH6]|uniref:CHAT domain-containing protein n=1 Tax=Panacibacter microcysteis TaxID=2793269 RepID=A0A931DYL1_9BACT|nr:CHAT domain-containing protein [Panacibacter microcysteis]MBG9375322.1 CHAT domain-containing protein [Panacibacter microcysteis]